MDVTLLILNNQQPSLGISCAIGAWILFSLNDVGFKLLSDDYPLHQLVLFRSLIGLSLTLFLFAPLEGGWQVLRTKRIGVHLIRGSCIVFANMAFFLALATMPLSDVTTLFFIAPILITLFSVLFLGETVGYRRWVAIAVGLLGVVVMMRPGQESFRLVAILPVLSAAAYATMQMLTRKLGVTERASALAFYIQLLFVIVATVFGIIAGDGKFVSGAHAGNPTMEFLFRAWRLPDLKAVAIIAMLGLASGFGGYLISQAYRTTAATILAPFEYVALPLSIVWSVLFWGDWPDTMAWSGIFLILASGLYVFWREVWLTRHTAGSGSSGKIRPAVPHGPQRR